MAPAHATEGRRDPANSARMRVLQVLHCARSRKQLTRRVFLADHMFAILSTHFCSPVGVEGRGTDLGTE